MADNTNINESNKDQILLSSSCLVYASNNNSNNNNDSHNNNNKVNDNNVNSNNSSCTNSNGNNFTSKNDSCVASKGGSFLTSVNSPANLNKLPVRSDFYQPQNYSNVFGQVQPAQQQQQQQIQQPQQQFTPGLTVPKWGFLNSYGNTDESAYFSTNQTINTGASLVNYSDFAPSQAQKTYPATNEFGATHTAQITSTNTNVNGNYVQPNGGYYTAGTMAYSNENYPPNGQTYFVDTNFYAPNSRLNLPVAQPNDAMSFGQYYGGKVGEQPHGYGPTSVNMVNAPASGVNYATNHHQQQLIKQKAPNETSYAVENGRISDQMNKRTNNNGNKSVTNSTSNSTSSPLSNGFSNSFVSTSNEGDSDDDDDDADDDASDEDENSIEDEADNEKNKKQAPKKTFLNAPWIQSSNFFTN